MSACLRAAAARTERTAGVYREVPEKDAKDYADSIHAIFVETSAKNAININEVFIEISECISPVFDGPGICAHSVGRFEVFHAWFPRV